MEGRSNRYRINFQKRWINPSHVWFDLVQWLRKWFIFKLCWQTPVAKWQRIQECFWTSEQITKQKPYYFQIHELHGINSRLKSIYFEEFSSLKSTYHEILEGQKIFHYTRTKLQYNHTMIHTQRGWWEINDLVNITIFFIVTNYSFTNFSL